MKTAQQWASEIEELYESQKQGKTEAKQAREMNQTVKTLISLTKLQLQYNREKLQAREGAISVPLLEEPKNP